MPELPEVEQVKKTLAPHVVGKTIKVVDVRLPRLIQYPSAEIFAQRLVDQKIESILSLYKIACDRTSSPSTLPPLCMVSVLCLFAFVISPLTDSSSSILLFPSIYCTTN